MKLTLIRKYSQTNYCIGALYVDGEYFCDTLEDIDRNLSSSMSSSEIKKIKVPGQTAIPTGVYTVTLKVLSPKFSKSAFMKQYANGGYVPKLLDVPGFSDVLIHTGNSCEDTKGCILVGINTTVGQVTSSKETFKKLYPLLQSADDITINILQDNVSK